MNVTADGVPVPSRRPDGLQCAAQGKKRAVTDVSSCHLIRWPSALAINGSGTVFQELFAFQISLSFFK